MVDNRFYQLAAHLWQGGQFAYYWVPDGDSGKLTFWFDVSSPREVSNLWTAVNVYFGIHPSGASKTMQQRALIEDIAAVNCLFAEFDLAPGQQPGHLLDSILTLDIVPSVIVFSGGGYHCVPLDTEILTSNGWRKWNEVNAGDNVVGYNTNTESLELTTMTGKILKSDDELVHVHNGNFSAICTPDHRWVTHVKTGRQGTKLVKNQLTKARDISNRRHKIVVSAPFVEQKDCLNITEMESEVLGWIISDGRILSCDRLEITQSEKKYADIIRSLLNGIPHSEGYYHKDKPDFVTWRIGNGWARDLLTRSGLTYDSLNSESWSQFVLKLSPSCRKSFLKTAFYGDGTMNRGTQCMVQKMGDRADALNLAIFLDGNAPRISGKTASRPDSDVRVTRSGHDFATWNMKVEPAGRGAVWCPKTELGTWVMRQGDTITITGNCYWLLDQTYHIDSPEARQRIIDIQYAWDEYVTGDNHVKDLARVLRIPGTYNRKPEFAPNYPQAQIIKFDMAAQYELADLAQEVESIVAATAAKRTAVASVDVVPVEMDDNTILDKMREKDTIAAALWDGDMSAYADDHSNADLALCSKLAFWFGRDPMRIDRVFRGSALFRPKWLRDDYRNRTIDKAIASCTNTYSGGTSDPAKLPGDPLGVLGNVITFNGNDHTNGNHAPTNGTVPPQTPPPPATPPTQPQAQGPQLSGTTINATDTGNARRLVKLYGNDIRYITEWGKWFIWNGRYWAEDKTRRIEFLAKQVVTGMYIEASVEPDPDKRRTLVKWAMSSENQARIEAMVRSAQSEPGITITHAQLDRGAWFLNCKNGIVDLRTGKLHPHEKDALLTKYVDVEYRTDVDCPIWKAFLNKIMANDADIIHFIQRAVGYTLTGNVSEKCLFFMYGPKGNNGKSTFVEVLLALLGEYSIKSPIEMLMARYGNPGIPNDIAQLPGRRFVVTSETEQGRKLNETMVKDLTGMDTITARFMRQEYFSFQPTHKLWIYGNHKPVIKGRDEAIWNRIRLIPFMVQVPKAEQDKDLINKLIAELPGIFAWAVEGCMEWNRIGLSEPASVAQATTAYKTEMDSLALWIESNCTVDVKKIDLFKNLYQDYLQWSADHGENTISGREFGQALDGLGYVAAKGAGNKAIRKGIVTNTQDAINSANSVVNP